MPMGFLVCKQCGCRQGSGLTGAPVLTSYPVAKHAGASVGGLGVSDVGKMNLFGKYEQQQTLHPHRCDLDTDGDVKIVLIILNDLEFPFFFL